jgi:hypothetical protein
MRPFKAWSKWIAIMRLSMVCSKHGWGQLEALCIICREALLTCKRASELLMLFCAFNSSFRCLARRITRRCCEHGPILFAFLFRVFREKARWTIRRSCEHGPSSQYALSPGKFNAKKHSSQYALSIGKVSAKKHITLSEENNKNDECR